jgi:hypothetical protein
VENDVATAEEEGLPESIKRVGTTMAFPNEYPGMIYAFNWCLNGDGVTPLRRSAFRLTKPLDLKVAGLELPKTSPLKVCHSIHTFKLSLPPLTLGSHQVNSRCTNAIILSARNPQNHHYVYYRSSPPQRPKFPRPVRTLSHSSVLTKSASEREIYFPLPIIFTAPKGTSPAPGPRSVSSPTPPR